jgi:hypothetical protein
LVRTPTARWRRPHAFRNHFDDLAGGATHQLCVPVAAVAFSFCFVLRSMSRYQRDAIGRRILNDDASIEGKLPMHVRARFLQRFLIGFLGATCG